MLPSELLQKMTHREFTVLYEHYIKLKDGGKKPESKPMKPFVEMNPAKIARSIWMGRLGITEPVK